MQNSISKIKSSLETFNRTLNKEKEKDVESKKYGKYKDKLQTFLNQDP